MEYLRPARHDRVEFKLPTGHRYATPPAWGYTRFVVVIQLRQMVDGPPSAHQIARALFAGAMAVLLQNDDRPALACDTGAGRRCATRQRLMAAIH